jgi:hypothetical protein
MVNQQLIDYIKSVRKSGHDDESIRTHLMSHGYAKEDLDEAFNSPELSYDTQRVFIAQRPPAPARPTKNVETNNASKKKILPLIVNLLILAAFIFSILLWQQQSSVCEDVKLSIHKINEEEVLCIYSDNSKIQTILKNEGKELIRHFDVTVKGKNGESTYRIENANLEPDKVSMHVIDIAMDNVEEVTVIPFTEASCTKEQIKRTSIKTC